MKAWEGAKAARARVQIEDADRLGGVQNREDAARFVHHQLGDGGRIGEVAEQVEGVAREAFQVAARGYDWRAEGAQQTAREQPVVQLVDVAVRGPDEHTSRRRRRGRHTGHLDVELQREERLQDER